MTFEGLHNRGYFSSNRSTGGRGWDKIFEFSYPEILQSVKDGCTNRTATSCRRP